MQIYQGAGEGGSVQAKQNSFKHYLVKLFTWWNIAAIESAFFRVIVSYGTSILKTDYCQRFNWFPKAGPGKAELMKDLDQADPPSHQSVRKPLWRVNMKYEMSNSAEESIESIWVVNCEKILDRIKDTERGQPWSLSSFGGKSLRDAANLP